MRKEKSRSHIARMERSENGSEPRSALSYRPGVWTTQTYWRMLLLTDEAQFRSRSPKTWTSPIGARWHIVSYAIILSVSFRLPLQVAFPVCSSMSPAFLRVRVSTREGRETRHLSGF